jgi:hypothetical protein
MKTPIIEGFTQAGLESYLNARQYAALYWPTLFPLKPVNRLDGTTIIGDSGNRVAAHVISFDASAPKATRKELVKRYFDIPKSAISRVKSEKEILEHTITKALRGNDAVLEDYFNDVDFVYDAVQARLEWFALQAISLTKIKLSTTNNPMGIVNEEYVDFGMPTANKKTVAVVWSTANAATMTPIVDFKNVVKAARTAGVKLAKVLVSPDAFDLITGSTEFQTAAKSLVTGESLVLGNLTLDIVNSVLKALRLPELVIVDTSVAIEDAAGNITNANPFDSNHVTFIPQVNLGSMFNGPIAEEIEKPEEVIQSKRSNVLISVKKTFDPVNVITKGEANAFPSWPMVDKCYSLYTNNASTWA